MTTFATCRTMAVAVLLLLPVIATAQDSERDVRRPGDAIPFAPNPRPTHMWLDWPAGAMYEGDINLPVHLYSRTFDLENPDLTRGADPGDCLFIDLRYNSLTPTKIVTGCTITFTPHFIIRQLKGGSAPVQTPTFNPSLELNWHTLAIEPELAGGIRHAVLRTLHFRYAHYSNGQSGCLGATQQLLPDGTCSGEFTPSTPLNTVDGSFSTNYVDAGVTRSWVTYVAGAERHMHGPTLTGRVHVAVPPGEMNEELRSVYGRASVLGGYMVRTRGTLWGQRATGTLAAEVEYAFGRAPEYEPWRGSATGYLSFPGMYGFGVSAKYSAGFDYYNIGFGRTLSSVAVGIVIDHSRAMTLSEAAREAIARPLR